jgi:hypothetical protein
MVTSDMRALLEYMSQWRDHGLMWPTKEDPARERENAWHGAIFTALDD